MQSSMALSVLVERLWSLGWGVAWLLLLVCAVWALNHAWWRPRRQDRLLRAQGLQGTPYRFLRGDLKEYKRLLDEALSKPMSLSHHIIPRVEPFLHAAMNDLGNRFFSWFGPVPRVMIMDPELVREILSNKFGHFERATLSPLGQALGTGLLSYNGGKWAKHRRILNPAFHVEKLKRMLPAFSASCGDLVGRWENLVGQEGSCELDVWPEFQYFTGDVISRGAFGSNYAEGRRIFQLQLELAQLVVQAIHSAYIPGYRFLPTPKNNRIKAINKEIRSLLRGIIRKREEAMKTGEASGQDLLGLLMESNIKQFQEHGNKNAGLTIDEVVEECKLFYLAGQETTAVLLTWTMVVLSMHPEWQERAREEVLQVLGKDKPEFDGLNRLKIVTMILYEVLRLYPPLLHIQRRTYKTVEIGNVSYPPGTLLALPIVFLHHDQILWGEDASEFKPERFAQGIAKASRDQVAFFPFGGGPRVCIGQNFALLEAKMGLSWILRRFWFELSPSYAHAPHSVVTLRPQHGAQLRLHKLGVVSLWSLGWGVAWLLLLVCAVWALNHAWWRPRRQDRLLRAQGLQGTPYRFLRGDLKEDKRLLQEALSKPMPLSHHIIPRVEPFLHAAMNDLGRRFFSWFGPLPRVMIMDPELVREILSNKFGHFERTTLSPLGRAVATGLLSYNGGKWAKHRRILNPAFHVEKLKRMLPAFSASCGDLVGRWENLVGQEGSCELDVWPEFQYFTGDVISRAAFSSNYEEGRRIFQLQLELAQLVVQAIHSSYIPGYRFLPTPMNNRIKAINKEIRSLLRGIIRKREEAMKTGEASGQDLLGLLMESNIKQFQEHGNKNAGMTIDEVVEECKLFYFAGQETTAVLLTWTMVVLSMHPEWQERAREEVLQVLGKDKPEFDGLNRLKIVTMILYEVLRLYPPLLLMQRRTYKTVEIGNVSYPPGTLLALPIVFLHHDQILWGEDASEFKPERFAEGIAKASRDQVAFFPFGGGPRICIGQNFALLEAKMGLSTILQRFWFELSPSYAHAPHSVVTLRPQHGAQLRLHKVGVVS
ncbi:hypothetical protein C4D60_Mb04t02720 [Musa balbisiana]|uniref:Cytochrome P450 n=1 Tax=Musa balbisiana TaxID=52838 RepID=A0A4S8K959_MUSBA|nr:hypothetical protein C4D60_Mb04t02720 [Musa balbisiana]